VPKKEGNSSKRGSDKGEKIHSQKHEDTGLEGGGKSRGVDKVNETARGFGNAKKVGQGTANERGFEKNNEAGQKSNDGTGLGNFDGSGSLGNFDGSANLGKPAVGKGCLSSIIAVMVIIVAVIII
jgi:hypothetical protein